MIVKRNEVHAETSLGQFRFDGSGPIDVHAPGFVEECARQSRLMAEADQDDPELEAFLDAAPGDIEGWT